MNWDFIDRGGVQRYLLLLALTAGLTWGFRWSVQAPYLRGLGYSGTEYGLLGAASVFTTALFTFLSGFLSDLFGARKVIIIGLLSVFLAMLFISIPSTLYIVVGFLLSGMGGGLWWTAETVLVSRAVREEKLHYAFSYVGAANSIGGAAGSFLGWFPVLLSKYSGIGLIDAYSWSIRIISLLVFIQLYSVLHVREQRTAVMEKRDYKQILRGVRGLGKFYYIILIEILIGLGAAMSIHNIDYYFSAKYNTTSAELGSIFGLQQLIMAFIMIALPSIADTVGGPLKLYLLITFPSIPLLIGMTLTNNYLVASALFLIRSIMMNVANPLFNAFSMSLVPSEKRGIASAFISLSWTLPGGGGRALGGFLLDIDLELPLRLTAALYTFSLTLLALIFGRSRNSHEKQ